MPVIAPFRGLTYDFNSAEDFSSLVAPPYDVIPEDQQAELYKANPYNVIRLILGKKKTGDSDWDNQYTRAADFFKRWESQSTLIRGNTPSLYLTSLTYDPGNGDPKCTRWGIIALVRIEDETSTAILPHERTFSAHKDDRLKLMRACSAQFSQIFALYEDAENRVMEACRNALEDDPQVSFSLQDGTLHRMWVLHAPSVLKKVTEAFAQKVLLIADGHHRYETARNYRNIMRARHGKKPLNRAYEFTMMYLSNMSHRGLTILPSHRLIKRAPNFSIQPFLKTMGEWFQIKKIPFVESDPPSNAAAFRRALSDAGQNHSSIGLYCNGAHSGYLFSLKKGMRKKMGSDLHPALQKLDVLVLSRFILQRSLGFTKEDLNDEGIFQYRSSLKSALSLVESGDFQMALLLNPTKIEQVKEIAGLSLVMPRKSTYFYPKVLSGLVFNRIDPHEIIQIP
jgi:uncharacterized protein (DUF1015 family)